MALKRTVYAILTVAAFATFVWTEHGAALFAFVMLLTLPVVSLALLFVAGRRVKIDMSLSKTCMRGGKLDVELAINVSPRLFIACAEAHVDIINTTFGKTERKIFVFPDLFRARKKYQYVSDYSGRIVLSAVKVRLVDIFGVCALSTRIRREAEGIVSPVLYDGLQVSLEGASRDVGFGDKIVPDRRGSDRSEIFGVRDYVVGDSMNAVHWKLTSKFDSLKSKEYGKTSNFHVLVLVDLSRKKHGHEATDEQLNAVLDVAVSLSESFRNNGTEHCVGWITDGEFRFSEVSGSESFVRMTDNLMSAKVTPDDARAVVCLASSEESERFSKCVFVSCGAAAEEFEALDCDVVAVSVCDGAGESTVGNVRLVEISPDGIEKAIVAGAL